MPEVGKKGLKTRNMTKIDILSPDRLQNIAKNKKTRWKIFERIKNTAQKNAREISGIIAPAFSQTLKRAKDNNQDAMNDLKLLRRELKEVDNKVAKLFEALTDGLVSDSKGFKDHNDKLEARRDELTRLIILKEGNLNLPMRYLSNAQLDRFSATLKDMLHSGPKGFRKEYMKLLVSRVDVGKQNITVTGPKAALAMALKAGNASKERVSSFVRDWCTRLDSNQ